MTRTAIVVVGMHRSGTSALTRAISLMGAELPRTVMPATQSNAAGHWEPEPIQILNDEMLEAAGSSWSDWRPLPVLSEPERSAFQCRAREILAAETGQADLIVLKDPRFSRLLPFWTEALDACGFAVRFVIALRAPAEVAASLLVRDRMPEVFGRLCWLRYVLEAEAGTRGAPRAVVTYDALMADPVSVMRKVGEVIDVPWPREPADAASALRGFLNAELRHHRGGVTPDDWTARAWSLLQACPPAGPEADARRELDALRAAFDAASSSFGDVFAVAQQADETTRRLATAEEAAEAATRRADEAEGATRHAASRIEALEADAKARAEARRAELSREHAERARSDAHQRRLEAQVAELSGTVTAQRRERAAQRRQEGTAAREIGEARRRLANAEARHAAARQEAAHEAEQARADKVRALLALLTIMLPKRYDAKRHESAFRAAARLLVREGVVDEERYRTAYPDVGASGGDPAFHFVRFGLKEGREATPRRPAEDDS